MVYIYFFEAERITEKAAYEKVKKKGDHKNICLLVKKKEKVSHGAEKYTWLEPQ